MARIRLTLLAMLGTIAMPATATPAIATPAIATPVIATPAIATPVPGPVAGAAPAPAPAPAAVSLPDLIAQALELGQAGDCKGLLAKLDPLVPGLPAGKDRNTVQVLRLNCLAAAGRGGEVGAVQRELATADPHNPIVRGFGVMVAAGAGDMTAAGTQLAILAESMPAALSGINADTWRSIAQRLTEQGNVALRDRLVVALARADWRPADDGDVRDQLAQGAIEALLRRGETTEAALMIDRIDAPETLAGMAMERVYRPVWPQVEARLGDHMGTAIDAFAADRLASFAASPDDLRARRDAVRAFLLLGRYAEASETAAPIRIADGMDEDAVAIVRMDAQVIAASGRRDAALARLQPFAAIDFARTPVAVSGVLGLAETLDEAGRSAEALGVARTGLAHGTDALSAWGTGWLRRTEVCALSALGRTREAAAALAPLIAHPGDNEAATVEASLCAHEDAGAAKLAIATLATPEGAGRIVDQFQPDQANWAPAPSRLRGLWLALLKRGDVKAAFERAGRVLPTTLWPQATPRAIPRPPSGGGPTT